MSVVSANLVKDLRERTGAGMMDCKKALDEAGGDMEKAVRVLREKGLAKSAKVSGRKAGEGLVAAYVHTGGKVGALVEINCETDFVARTDEYQALARDLAIQVVASNPRWIRRDQVPAAVLDTERDILRQEAKSSGKPPAVIEKMVEGRLEKFYKEACLLEQPFVREQDITVEEVIQRAITKMGEKIEIKRVTRFQLGEDLAGS